MLDFAAQDIAATGRASFRRRPAYADEMNPSHTSEQGVLALTFDDGPSEWTPSILDLLAEHDARATFFILGANVSGREHTLRRALE